MKLTCQQFRDWPAKAVTLLGMSGVGKTTLGGLLPLQRWFHYSGDYRIGTRYLDEAILDDVKSKAMQHAELRVLLQQDLIYIRNNITLHKLELLAAFLGKIGNPELGGLSVAEFKRRQRLFRAAEIQAMRDVEHFISKAQRIYGYPHFLNDAGGSICSLKGEECWHRLSAVTLVLYLETDAAMQQTLLERAQAAPKPLNYDDDFLDTHLQAYLQGHGLARPEQIVPDEFVQWIFPKLIDYRKPRYEAIADRYGYRVDARQILRLRDEQDFIDLVCEAIDA